MSHFLVFPSTLQSPVTLQSIFPGVRGAKTLLGPVCALSPAVWAVAVRGLRLLVHQAVLVWADSPQCNELCLGSHGGELGGPMGGIPESLSQFFLFSSQVKWVSKIFIFFLFIPSLGFVTVVVVTVVVVWFVCFATKWGSWWKAGL